MAICFNPAPRAAFALEPRGIAEHAQRSENGMLNYKLRTDRLPGSGR